MSVLNESSCRENLKNSYLILSNRIPADQRESYSTEQIVFYQDPVEFMTSKFPHISDDAQGEVPSHIVMFQHLEWVMEEDPFKERYQKVNYL